MTRAGGSAAIWAASVVASNSSSEGGIARLIERSYQRSATMPCCAGQAPVARVAMPVDEKVLAAWRQLGKLLLFRAICEIRRRKAGFVRSPGNPAAFVLVLLVPII